jgi:hypothetical protein
MSPTACVVDPKKLDYNRMDPDYKTRNKTNSRMDKYHSRRMRTRTSVFQMMLKGEVWGLGATSWPF